MDTEMQSSPLDRLFVDSSSLDEELLADTILPYVQLYGDTGEIVPTKAWNKLNLKGKILVYLLARKALKISKRVPSYQEEVTPSQIEDETGLKGNSVRPTLSWLLNERLVRMRVGEGEKGERRYFVTNHALPRVSEYLSGTGEE